MTLKSNSNLESLRPRFCIRISAFIELITISFDGSRRVSRGGSGGGGGGVISGSGGVGAVVRPHSASDSKTVMESLVHFFHDVVAGAEVRC